MIRISAAGLCRIEIEGGYLLGYNKARLAVGHRVLAPIGGVAEFHEAAREFLQNLGAVFTDGRDLRLELPETSVPAFDSWFRSHSDRELTPLRELREELVGEHQVVLPWVDPAIHFAALRTEVTETDRPGLEGRRTLRYLEIFDVAFNSACTSALRDACHDGGCGLVIVARKDIEHWAENEVELASTARLLYL